MGKLQGLTADYATILEAEKRTELMRNETQKTSAQIDQKLGKLVKEQAEIKRESERLASLELSIERTMMENEDKAAQLSL